MLCRIAPCWTPSPPPLGVPNHRGCYKALGGCVQRIGHNIVHYDYIYYILTYPPGSSCLSPCYSMGSHRAGDCHTGLDAGLHRIYPTFHSFLPLVRRVWWVEHSLISNPVLGPNLCSLQENPFQNLFTNPDVPSLVSWTALCSRCQAKNSQEVSSRSLNIDLSVLSDK